MRILIAPIILGISLTSAVPAMGQSTISPNGNIPPARLVAGTESTSDHNTYLQKVRTNMQAWRRKLQAFNENAEADGELAGKSAKDDLNAAWIKTEAASRRLQNAGKDGWEDARLSFEAASDHLAATWHKLNLTGR